MHIAEGVLSPVILGGGAVLAALGVTLGLRRLDYERLMTVAVAAAVFFVGSLVHVPVGLSSAHLILNGLVGALLGWGAFPAILVALVLQGVLFQYGGITVLGVNTVTMATPAVLSAWLFCPLLRRPRWRFLGGFCLGACSVAGAALLTALALGMTDEGFVGAAQVLLVAHVPVMVVEGLVTALLVGFLARVRPAILGLGEEETR